jgi:hypothetical protein
MESAFALRRVVAPSRETPLAFGLLIRLLQGQGLRAGNRSFSRSPQWRMASHRDWIKTSLTQRRNERNV